jgi:hypothetical protein
MVEVGSMANSTPDGSVLMHALILNELARGRVNVDETSHSGPEGGVLSEYA